MTKLIDELKQEHAFLVQMLDQVRSTGVGSHAAHKHLLSAKAKLLAHLEKENRLLYPALREAAKRDPVVDVMLATFAAEMEQVADAAMTFFEKYSQSGEGLNFGGEFGALVGALTMRIRREESMLYAAYDR
jgi:hypothetical protein